MVLGPPVGVIWHGPERAQVVEVLTSRGMHVIDDPSPGMVRVVVIEAGLDSTVALVRAFASAGARVVVSGRGVDDLSTPGLRALGADVVVTVGELVRSPDAHLPEIA
jgi:hypothetical protein